MQRHSDEPSIPILALVVVVAVVLPVAGVWPWLLAAWYGAGVVVTLLYAIVLLPLADRFVGQPFGDVPEIGGFVPGTRASPFTRLRNLLTNLLEPAWRSLSWPVFLAVFPMPSFRKRLFNANPRWSQSDQFFSTVLSIRYEPWVAVVCLANAAGVLWAAFHPVSPPWLRIGAIAVILCAVLFRCLRYIVGIDLPTALRRSHDRPYVLFFATAILDFAALACALIALRAALTGTTPAFADVQAVIKAMFSTTALTLPMTGRPAPLDAVVADVAGKVWGLSVLTYLWKFRYFFRTDDDYRAMASSYAGQGRFAEALAAIKSIDQAKLNDEDRTNEGLFSICVGDVEAGVALMDKIRRLEDEEPLGDTDLIKLLIQIITVAPLSSAALAEIIVYAAQRFGDLLGVVIADRSAMEDVLARQDVESVAERLAPYPLTSAMAHMLTGASQVASEVESYAPGDRVESFMKQLIMLNLTVVRDESGPWEQRLDPIFQQQLPLFETALDYTEEEVFYMRLFLAGSWAGADARGSRYAALFHALLDKYDELLATRPDFMKMIEENRPRTAAIRDYMRRAETFDRADAVSEAAVGEARSQLGRWITARRAALADGLRMLRARAGRAFRRVVVALRRDDSES